MVTDLNGKAYINGKDLAKFKLVNEEKLPWIGEQEAITSGTTAGRVPL